MDYLLRLPSERVLKLFDQYQGAHRFVAVSQSDKQRLTARLPHGQVLAVQNVPPLPPMHAAPNVPLQYPETGLRLLSVGRLEMQKGFDRLIAVLGDPQLRELDWHWYIVGDGSLRTSLEEQVKQLHLESRITFAGGRPAHELFAGANLVICPSRFEGMPLVPLEAQLAGVPVLLSDIAPHREAFGAVSECFLPSQEADWKQRLQRLLASHEEVRRLGRLQQSANHENPRERFWQAYRAIYEAVVGGDEDSQRNRRS
jgi:glycosyltransferase involved in cell wall biosynthesis